MPVLAPLFPKAIGYASNPSLVTPEMIEDIKRLPRSPNTHNSVSEHNKILTTKYSGFKTKYKPLVDYLYNELTDFYSNALGVPIEDGDIKPVITQSWFTYSSSKEKMHGHKHPNSIVSGVFYIHAKENYDEIIFTKDKEYTNLDWGAVTRNEYTTNAWHVPVKTGDLILFGSETFHHFNEVVHDEERISLAFNSWLTGEFGSWNGLTGLQYDVCGLD